MMRARGAGAQSKSALQAQKAYTDAVLLGQRLRKPVVITARGTDVNLIADFRLPRRWIRWAAGRAAGIVTVSEALREYEAGSFDLIISDIGLPDATGLDLVRRAVGLRGPVAAIALTGYGMEEDIRRSREAGFTAHLTKPIDFAKLEAMIRQVTPTGACSGS